MSETRWSDIFLHLKKAGFAVYAPSEKEGECKKPYIVVKGAGVSKAASVSSSVALFDVMVYLPKNQYSKVESFVRDVENALDGLWPMIRPTHFQTAPFYDENVKGWMVSIQYQNYQKNKRP